MYPSEDRHSHVYVVLLRPSCSRLTMLLLGTPSQVAFTIAIASDQQHLLTRLPCYRDAQRLSGHYQFHDLTGCYMPDTV